MRVVIVLGSLLVAIGMLVWSLGGRIFHYWGWPGVIAGSAVAAIGIYVWSKAEGGPKFKAMSLRNDAEQARNAGDFEGAEKLLKSGLEGCLPEKGNSARAVLHYELAQVYDEMDRLEDAIAQVRFAVVAAEGSKAPFGRQIAECAPGYLCDLCGRAGLWADQEVVMRELAKSVPNSQKMHVQVALGRNLMEQGRLEEATRILTSCAGALEEDPATEAEQMPLLWLALDSLARTELKAGRLEAAIAHSEKLRELVMRHPVDQDNLQNLLVEIDRFIADCHAKASGVEVETGS